MLDGVVTAAALELGESEQQNSCLLELRREAVHTRDQIADIVSTCTYMYTYST